VSITGLNAVVRSGVVVFLRYEVAAVSVPRKNAYCVLDAHFFDGIHKNGTGGFGCIFCSAVNAQDGIVHHFTHSQVPQGFFYFLRLLR